MATTREDLARWFQEGKKLGATHMIVACDTYDWEDYPIFVMPGEDTRTTEAEAAKHAKVMEVYSLSLDPQRQLNEYRAFHYD